jgi:hypothetical protein
MTYDYIDEFPHCDQRVLHAPGTCDVCDEHEEWQELRDAWGINFTGESDVNKLTDPAEAVRPLETIYAWEGNRPQSEEEDEVENEEVAATPIFEYTTKNGSKIVITFSFGIWAVLSLILASLLFHKC